MSSLLWFGLIAVFFFLMMRGGCGSHVMGHGHGQSHDDQSGQAPGGQPMIPTGLATDPVCGKQVDPASAKSSVHQGSLYFFCSAEHRNLFEAEPDRYIKHGSVPATTGEQHAHG